MKSHISTLFVRPNPVWEEKISIGLFGISGDHIRFVWSEKKLPVVKKWLPEEVYTSLRKTIKNIHKEIQRLEKVKTNPGLFRDDVPDLSYFSYLSRYNNGLLGFTEPTPVADPDMITDDRKFRELFRLYIHEVKDEEGDKGSFRRMVNRRLKSEKISSRADTHYKLDNKIVSTIYRPHLIDLISVNGTILAGKTVDFSSTPETIESGLYEFRVLVEGLSRFIKESGKFREEGKFLALYSKPAGKKQESILRNALNDSSKPFELEKWERIDEIEEMLEKENYRKFSEVIR